MTPTPMTIDAAITQFKVDEGKLQADQTSLANIDIAISTASSGRPIAAQAVTDDITAYNADLDAIAAATQAAKLDPTTGLPVVPPVANPSPNPTAGS